MGVLVYILGGLIKLFFGIADHSADFWQKVVVKTFTNIWRDDQAYYLQLIVDHGLKYANYQVFQLDLKVTMYNTVEELVIAHGERFKDVRLLPK